MAAIRAAIIGASGYSGEELIRLLGELRDEQNMTVVMVTHDQKAAEQCDRVVRMSDGSVSGVM